MRLLADCGNTAIKLAVCDSGVLVDFRRLRPDVAELSGFFQPHDNAVDELVLLAGSHRNGELVRTWWSAIGRGRRMRVIGADLPLPDLGQYPGCGADRILAGIAGCYQLRKPLVVLDAGTATTFTAWRCDAAGTPRFLGGLILPGARICIAALASQAPALPAVEPLGPAASACQRDTVGAIAAAVGIGYGPMVAACLLKLGRETGIHDTLATGGNLGVIVDSLVIRPQDQRPALVLEGLDLFARGHLAPRE
jgi:pantothenate kinase type III